VACAERPVRLTDEEAYAVLEPFFLETRKVFVEAGLARCAKTRLEIDGEAHDTPRHFAGCTEDGLLIVVAPQLADLPVDNVVAIFAHEFGHSADFLYPARFVVADGELVSSFEGKRRRALEEIDQRAEYNRRKQWEDRGSGDVEEAADRIAQDVTGREIRYAGPCVLQTYGSGRTRPAELR
jgi:hypothetical protein